MNKNWQITFYATSILFLLLACSKRSELKSYGEMFTTIFRTDSAVFRGYNLEETKAFIKSKENDKNLVDETDNYLYYDYAIGENQSFSIYYIFEDNHLKEINLSVFLEKEEDGKHFAEELTELYDTKFGDFVKNGDYTVWSNNGIEVEMIDESEEYGYGKVSVVIYKTYNKKNKEVKHNL